MASVVLNTEAIKDFETFHAECARAFGFPSFYGRNMDAWVDCLSYLPQGDGMSSFTLGPDEQLFIHVPNYEALSNVSARFLQPCLGVPRSSIVAMLVPATSRAWS